jgi:putative ABC transport system permease protein
LINLIGLSVGFASCFALREYTSSELRSNQYHRDYERIARVGTYWRFTNDDGKNWSQVICGFSKADLPGRFADDFPDVESYARLLPQAFFKDDMVSHGDRISISVTSNGDQENIFQETKAVYADSNLFLFFTIPLLYGEAEHVLREHNFVVLSETVAKKYFGNRNPVGELLKLNNTVTLEVSGVYKDLPHNTHFDFDLVISNTGRWRR